MTSERVLAFVDIDGVVADVRHRLEHVESHPKDWDAFFAAAPLDPVHEDGVVLVRLLEERDHEVVFLTGRPDRLRADTAAWLERHDLGRFQLVMRPAGDRRPANVVKLELLRRLARGREVGVVVDDDPLVVEMMRKAGYPTLHADWEQRSTDEAEALLAAQEVDGES